MSEGDVGLGSRSPLDFDELAKKGIALGLSLAEFDSLDLTDVGIVFDGLARRFELQNEGVIAQLIRQNTYFTARYAPFFKAESKPKKLTDVYKFSHEATAEKAEIEAKSRQYDALALYLTQNIKS